MKPPVKTEIFVNSLGEFFHYEPLFTSSFSQNLIILEAEMISKILSYHKIAKLVKYYSGLAKVKDALYPNIVYAQLR
jgi:hypothetical protein